MTIDKKTSWGSASIGESDINGPKVETDASLLDADRLAGFTAERLAYPRLNRLLNETDDAINEIASGGLNPMPDGTMMNHIMRFYPCDDVGHYADSPSNILRADTVSEQYSTDMCVYVDAKRRKHLLTLELVGGTVDDFLLSTKERTQNDLTSSLPAANGAWLPCSICTDGTYAYVLWVDTGHVSAADLYRLHAYKISDWTPKAGWASTGIDVSGTTVNGSGIKGDVIIATSTKIAVNRSWLAMSESNVQQVRLMTDGTVSVQGNGDSNLGAGDYPRTRCFCSDGTYIYWACDNDGAATDRIFSMSIAAGGSTGCGGTGWPFTLPAFTVTSLFCACGIIVAGGNGEVHILSASVADRGSIADSGSYADKFYTIGYDGASFWALGENTASSIQYMTRINNVQAAMDGSDVVHNQVFGNWALSQTADVTNPVSKLVFDGCDFYFSGNAGSGNSGIYRFPKPLLRA